MSDNINIALVGHVDHGKSTILGRLLANTKALPQGKLKQIKEKCRLHNKTFEYAFLLDALKEEQSQGITIDTARCFFKYNDRTFMFLDAPGHVEFIKNMITGAAHSDAAFLVIDANEGLQENSIRHGYLLHMLNIKQVIVLINKIDLVEYKKDKIIKVQKQANEFLSKIGIKPLIYLPLSGTKGDNITEISLNTPWYKNKPLLEILYRLKKRMNLKNKPFRMPIQGVYKFTEKKYSKRIIAGKIETGKLALGDELIFSPYNNNARVTSIEIYNKTNVKKALCGQSIAITLDKPIYVTRGQIATITKEPQLNISDTMEVKLFWLGKNPLRKKTKYFLKLTTEKVTFEIIEIKNILDISSLKRKQSETIHQNEVAQCVLKLDNKIAFDNADQIINTARFVIVENYQIKGGGIIIKSLAQIHKNRINKKRTKTCVVMIFDKNKKLLRTLASNFNNYLDENLYSISHDDSIENDFLTLIIHRKNYKIDENNDFSIIPLNLSKILTNTLHFSLKEKIKYISKYILNKVKNDFLYDI